MSNNDITDSHSRWQPWLHNTLPYEYWPFRWFARYGVFKSKFNRGCMFSLLTYSVAVDVSSHQWVDHYRLHSTVDVQVWDIASYTDNVLVYAGHIIIRFRLTPSTFQCFQYTSQKWHHCIMQNLAVHLRNSERLADAEHPCGTWSLERMWRHGQILLCFLWACSRSYLLDITAALLHQPYANNRLIYKSSHQPSLTSCAKYLLARLAGRE